MAIKYNLCQVGSVLVFYGIPEIHGWSSIDVHATQEHDMRRIARMP